MALGNRKPWYGVAFMPAPLQAGNGLGKADLTALAPRSRAHQRMALDALTPKRAAADRQDAPSNTARTTRSQRSTNSALDIPAGLPPAGSLNHILGS
jgi:hypothetical protein